MSFTANSTGGEYKHKLTVDEIPNHKHAVYIQNTTSNPQVNAPKWTVALPNSWKQVFTFYIIYKLKQIEKENYHERNSKFSKS